MPKVLSWKKNGLIQNFRYFPKITVPVRTGTIVIVPVRSLSLRTLPVVEQTYPEMTAPRTTTDSLGLNAPDDRLQ